jgi:hypothetical protein
VVEKNSKNIRTALSYFISLRRTCFRLLRTASSNGNATSTRHVPRIPTLTLARLDSRTYLYSAPCAYSRAVSLGSSSLPSESAATRGIYRDHCRTNTVLYDGPRPWGSALRCPPRISGLLCLVVLWTFLVRSSRRIPNSVILIILQQPHRHLGPTSAGHFRPGSRTPTS